MARMEGIMRKRKLVKALVPVAICVAVMLSVFFFLRYQTEKRLSILLVSNASADQVEGIDLLISKRRKNPPYWEGMVLDRLDLGARRFSHLEFRNCDFSGSRFDSGEFADCRFKDCIFRSCDLREMTIRNTTFEGCNFSGAYFTGTTLENVDLTFSVFKDARIKAEQLRGAQGLDSATFDEGLQAELGGE